MPAAKLLSIFADAHADADAAEERRAEAVALARGATGRGAREADEAVVRLESLKKRLES